MLVDCVVFLMDGVVCVADGFVDGVDDCDADGVFCVLLSMVIRLCFASFALWVLRTSGVDFLMLLSVLVMMLS